MVERLCSKEMLAERIIAAREAKGWNRTKLALHSGASDMALYNIEHALYYPRLETLDVICAALGLTLGGGAAMLRVTIETDAEDVQGLKELLAMEIEQRFGCRVRVVEIERIRKKEGEG